MSLNNLDTKDWIKIGKGFLIASAAAGLTYVAAALDAINTQAETPAIMAILSALVNALRIWVRSLKNNGSRRNKATNEPDSTTP